MRRLAILLALVLAGCAPRLAGVDPSRVPSPDTWDPQPAPIEWWYVSAYLPGEGLAFHWAFFKAYAPEGMRVFGLPARAVYPYPMHAAHLALTDLGAGTFRFLERDDFTRPDARVRVLGSPLRLAFDDWRLERRGDAYRLVAGPLDLWLVPLKPPVVHPPGYSGSAETGRMYYVSYTRLALYGRVAGRRVQGFAWMDHQWGEQLAGRRVGWDWFGLHLSDWSELMLYRVRDLEGRVRAIHASVVLPSGRVERLGPVTMAPRASWRSPASGYRYAVAWEVAAPGLRLRLRPLRLAQELRTTTTRVAYWEGPVEGEGERAGHGVKAWGMGEFIGGPWPR